MALLVFMSTLYVSIGKHYCGDSLVDVALFADAENCGMEAADQNFDTSEKGTIISKTSCCKDVVDLFEGQDELSMENTQVLKTDEKVFILSFSAVFNGLIFPEPQKDPPFEHYSPPIHVKDIQVLNQVYII